MAPALIEGNGVGETRRGSYWLRRPSIAGSHRLTEKSIDLSNKSVFYENTYSLGPDSHQKIIQKNIQLVSYFITKKMHHT